MLRLPMCCHLATQESTGLQEAINPLKLALQQVDNSTSRSSNLESYLVHSRILSLRSLKWRTCRRKQVETMSLCLKWGFSTDSQLSQPSLSNCSLDLTCICIWRSISKHGRTKHADKQRNWLESTSDEQWAMKVAQEKQAIDQRSRWPGHQSGADKQSNDTQFRKWPANRGDKPAAASSCLEHSPQTFSARYKAQLAREATWLVWKGFESMGTPWW